MSSGTLTAIIAAAAVVLGALLTAASATYSASRKTAELRLTYAQQLQEGYLQNARQYLSSVYMPINISLYDFQRAYADFRESLTEDDSQVRSARRATFNDKIESFVQNMQALFAQGADAFLSTELDQRLTALVQFVSASRQATGVQARRTISISAYGMGFQYSDLGSFSFRIFSLIGGFATWAPLPFVGFPVHTSTSLEVLAAPFESEEFEGRMAIDIPVLKGLIKEVTLGKRI
jgi:hypothetical protein